MDRKTKLKMYGAGLLALAVFAWVKGYRIAAGLVAAAGAWLIWGWTGD